jgi:hypothetical protein
MKTESSPLPNLKRTPGERRTKRSTVSHILYFCKKLKWLEETICRRENVTENGDVLFIIDGCGEKDGSGEDGIQRCFSGEKDAIGAGWYSKYDTGS